MRETTKQFLELFFNPNETICVSPNKYGYHSIKQSDLNGDIRLISPNETVSPCNIKEEDINLVAINPINGFRTDKNVTAFRSFLVEIDEGSLVKQKDYIEKIGMPYSICVFSGNKSLHYGIVLDKDLPNLKLWKIYCQWILNIVKQADQQTKNPSRNIRMPNNKRKDGRQLIQGLVKINKRIGQDELNIWLNQYPEAKPKETIKKLKSYTPMYKKKFPSYVYRILEELRDGVKSQRNNSWFHISGVMASRGLELDEIIASFEPYFIEENNFKKTEWLNTIKSAYKREQDG